jgi:hypothetical protein
MNDNRFQNIRKYVELQEQFHEMHRSYNRMREIIEPIQKVIDSKRQFMQIEESMLRLRTTKLFNPDILERASRVNTIKENIDLFNKNTPEYLVKIAKHGWYLDLQTDFDLSMRLAYNIENEEFEKVDDYLIDYYLNNLDLIIEKLKTNHPKRKGIFEELKIGLISKHYNLVIPLILSQIDGACYDWTKKLFFIKNKKKESNPYLPMVSNELININNSFMEAFLSPFFNDAPIFTSEKQLEFFPTNFNRHRVLHGLDTNFGTQLNCFKALSLLSYCEDILTRLVHDFEDA